MPNPLDTSHLSTVRSAHGLVDLLKESRPDLHPQIEELQAIVTNAHKTLHEHSQLSEAVSDLNEQQGREVTDTPSSNAESDVALVDLEAAYQSLKDLTHANKQTA